MPDPPLPLPDAVPWDAPIASIAGWWIGCICSECGNTKLMPLRLLASQRGWNLTLRRIVPRVSCSSCRARPSRLWLTDDAAGSHGRAGAVAAELDLLGEASPGRQP